MMPELSIPIPFAAIACGLYAGWLLWVIFVRQRVTANRDAALTERLLKTTDQPAQPQRQLDEQLAAAGVAITPATFTLLRLACGGAGFLAALIFRLPLLILAAAAVA